MFAWLFLCYSGVFVVFFLLCMCLGFCYHLGLFCLFSGSRSQEYFVLDLSRTIYS